MKLLPYLPQCNGVVALGRMNTSDSTALEKHRIKQLRHLLHHAYNRVPYYRQLFDREQIKPDDIRMIEDLSVIPVSSKNELRISGTNSPLAGRIETGKLIKRKTSGSSGEPFEIYRSWYEERLLQSFRRRALQLLGMRPRDRSIMINRVRDTDPNDKQFFFNLSRKVGLFQLDQIDCFLPFPDMLEQLQKKQFEVLGGLALVLYHLAIHINTKRINVPSPRFIVTGGEQVTAYMRREIERAFGAKLYDFYSTHECNLVAWQCGQTDHYHVNDASVILEVINDGYPARPGEQGEAIVTNLYSYNMPFIRYRLDDLVVRGNDSCSCGLACSTIKEIDGRSLDYLYLADGRKVHPYQIIRFLVHSQNPWVRQYQMVQQSNNHVTILVAPLRAVEQELIRQFKKQASAILGDTVHLDLTLVENIPREESGKFKVFKQLQRIDNLSQQDT